MLWLLAILVFYVIAQAKVDWNAVIEETNKNYAWYLENRELILFDGVHFGKWVLIRNKDIIAYGNVYDEIQPSMIDELGDIAIYVGDESRTPLSEQPLEIADLATNEKPVLTGFYKFDPPPDTQRVSFIKFDNVTNQFNMGSYDYDVGIPNLHKRLSIYAALQKDPGVHHGVNISFLYDTGAKHSSLTPVVYDSLATKFGFVEVSYPSRLIAYFGMQKIEFKKSERYLEPYNLFGTDISRFFKIYSCIFCRKFSIEPLQFWYKGESIPFNYHDQL